MAPAFCLTEKFYKPQLQADLKFNVYKDGAWGTFRNLLIDHSCLNHDTTNSSDYVLPEKWHGGKVSHLGINLKYLSMSGNRNKLGQCDLGPLDYVGRSADGLSVMGVALTDSDQLISNPQLTWNVPQTWTLEQAATVPVVYSTAYYMLVLTAKTLSSETVLVHAGNTAVGQAAISLAHNIGCTVYTTVANAPQKSYLHKRFPQMKDSHIVIYDAATFEVYLRLATGGVGAHVILSCLSGAELHSALRCLASLGRFIQLGENNLLYNNNIGMGIFLESTSIYGVTSDNLFNASADWLKRIHAAMEQGIKSGTVRPLKMKTFLKKDIHSAMLALPDEERIGKVVVATKSEDMKMNLSQTLQFDQEASYLVTGLESRDCVEFAGWLIVRGARKLVIACSKSTTSGYFKRKLHFLNKHYKVNISIAPLTTKLSAQVASELVQQASNMAPLHGVFILPMGEDVHSTVAAIRHLDHETRSAQGMTHFVSLLCDGSWAAIGERQQARLPAVAVHGDKLTLAQTLDILDQALANPENSVVLISRKEQSDNITYTDYDDDKPNLLLPRCLEDVVNLGEDLDSTLSSLVELPTLCPRWINTPDLPAVFLVPGLQGPAGRVLEPLARNLMYPAFYIRLPTLTSISNAAVQIAKDILSVQQKSPYTVVGVSWGGALAEEIGLQLKTQGHKTHVILVDGAPETIKAMVQQLGVGEEMQVNLLTRLLHITSHKEIQELKGLQGWESRLDRAVGGRNSDPAISHNLHRAISTIWSNLSWLGSYKPSSTGTEGLVSVIRPAQSMDDNSGCRVNEFEKPTNIFQVEGDHCTMLATRATATIINEIVLPIL